MKECKSGKKRHPSKEVAIIVAKRVRNSGLNVYRCSLCKDWHTGNSSTPVRRANRITELLRQSEAALKRRNSKKPTPPQATP